MFIILIMVLRSHSQNVLICTLYVQLMVCQGYFDKVALKDSD